MSDTRLRQAIFGAISEEHARTKEAVLAIEGRDELPADNPLLRRSIKNRFPYMDPLNHLQIELLRRQRGGETDARLARGIHITINGIAAGLRNFRDGEPRAAPMTRPSGCRALRTGRPTWCSGTRTLAGAVTSVAIAA